MNRTCIFIVLLLLFSPIVFADITKFDVPVSVNFAGEREFYVQWDGGLKYFRWDNNTIKSNETFSVIFYRDINTSNLCPMQADVIDSLTTNMDELTSTCKDLADANNMSLALELSDTKYSSGLQTEKIANCNSDLALAKDKADKYDSCIVSMSDYRNKYDTCSADLETKQKSSSSNPFLYGLGGAGITWFFMRKKPEQPSEFTEEGF